MLEISRLFIYPIKSLGGIELDALSFDALGPELDRRYMLVSASGKFISQRSHPTLSQIKLEPVCSVEYEGLDHKARPKPKLSNKVIEGFDVYIPGYDAIYLRANGLEIHAAPSKCSLAQVQVWSDQFNAYLLEHDLAKAVSQYLDEDVQLAFIPKEIEQEKDKDKNKNVRPVDEHFTQEGYEDQVGFADGFPSLLCYEESLHTLNQWIQSQASEQGYEHEEITIERFRPNIVLKQSSKLRGQKLEKYSAFAENNWQGIEAATMRLALVKPCSRCVMPTIQPETSKKQPLVFKGLKALNAWGGEVFFGQNALHQSRADDSIKQLMVGESVSLISF